MAFNKEKKIFAFNQYWLIKATQKETTGIRTTNMKRSVGKYHMSHIYLAYSTCMVQNFVHKFLKKMLHLNSNKLKQLWNTCPNIFLNADTCLKDYY